MTYAALIKSLQAGDIIVSQALAHEGQPLPAGAGGFGRAGEGSPRQQRAKKLLRAVVAAKARRRTRI